MLIKLIKYLVLTVSTLSYGYIAQAQENGSFLNNAASGITTYDMKTWNKVISDALPYQNASMRFYYIYLSDVLRDNCFTRKGNLDKEQLARNIKQYFDNLLDYTQNRRYNIRIFPEYNGTQPCNNSSVIQSGETDDGKLLINFPETLYKVLHNRKKYSPIVIKAIFPEKFTQTRNIALMNMKDPLVQDIYDMVLQQFAAYLEETVKTPTLSSATNASGSCKKGDFIARIEMGFIGPWGEGMTKYQDNSFDAKSLTAITEMYKKYFHKYILCAPSFGMRNTTTYDKSLYSFEYYLLTTKYGTLTKQDGLFTGTKEFGLFIDHIGSKDINYDFSLNYKGNDFKKIALQKYRFAPVIGENSGRLEEENERVLGDIKQYGISLCNVWTSINLDSIADNSLQKWREAASFFGYRFYINGNRTSIKDNTLKVFFLMGNRSYSPLYDDFWLPQIVIRDKDGKELQVIDIDKDLNLKSIPCLKSPLNYEVMVNTKKQLNVATTGCKVYFRIIDKCHINENMYLDNDGRTDRGEYLLLNSH